jgi:hypothetical protein
MILDKALKRNPLSFLRNFFIKQKYVVKSDSLGFRVDINHANTKPAKGTSRSSNQRRAPGDNRSYSSSNSLTKQSQKRKFGDDLTNQNSSNNNNYNQRGDYNQRERGHFSKERGRFSRERDYDKKYRGRDSSQKGNSRSNESEDRSRKVSNKSENLKRKSTEDNWDENNNANFNSIKRKKADDSSEPESSIENPIKRLATRIEPKIIYQDDLNWD